MIVVALVWLAVLVTPIIVSAWAIAHHVEWHRQTVGRPSTWYWRLWWRIGYAGPYQVIWWRRSGRVILPHWLLRAANRCPACKARSA